MYNATTVGNIYYKNSYVNYVLKFEIDLATKWHFNNVVWIRWSRSGFGLVNLGSGELWTWGRETCTFNYGCWPLHSAPGADLNCSSVRGLSLNRVNHGDGTVASRPSAIRRYGIQNMTGYHAKPVHLRSNGRWFKWNVERTAGCTKLCIARLRSSVIEESMPFASSVQCNYHMSAAVYYYIYKLFLCNDKLNYKRLKKFFIRYYNWIYGFRYYSGWFY